MIHVIASIKIKSSQIDQFVNIFKSNIPKVLEEDGCVEYSATIDYKTDIPIQELDSNVVTVIEKWDSLAALLAHLESRHMVKYKLDVEYMVEDISIKILENI
jgi:quinol monooxygenase YgiN